MPVAESNNCLAGEWRGGRHSGRSDYRVFLGVEFKEHGPGANREVRRQRRIAHLEWQGPVRTVLWRKEELRLRPGKLECVPRIAVLVGEHNVHRCAIGVRDSNGAGCNRRPEKGRIRDGDCSNPTHTGSRLNSIHKLREIQNCLRRTNPGGE